MQTSSRVPVKTSADMSHLSDNDLEAVDILVRAVAAIDKAYLAQREDNAYPPDLTVKEFKQYLEEHSDEREALESPFTLVRDGFGQELTTIPYADRYSSQLLEVRELLEEAASIVSHARLGEFLAARADAFENNDYDPSDILWVGLDDAPLEVTIGPYEEYEDMFMGLKRSFQGLLGVAVLEENKRLRRYQSWSRDFDRFLSDHYGSPITGAASPMVVVDEVVTGGFALRDSFFAQAYNLPNGEKVRQSVGSRKVFLRNVMRAKFDHITCKIAQRVASPELMGFLSFSSYFLRIVGHELAHGLGIYCKTGMRDLGHPLEEAKADVFGLLFLYYLADRGLIAQETVWGAIVTEVVDDIRVLRFGGEEAHAFGARIQYNWHLERGAISIGDGRLTIDEERVRPGLQSLADEFARIAISQDYEEARNFVERWGGEVEGLSVLLEKVQGIPVDIQPIYAV